MGMCVPNSYGFFWKDRDGGENSVNGIVADSLEAARVVAKKNYGYPGHRGGWWNYFVDDTRTLIERLGLVH